jgi:hypothetical protein
MGCGASHTSGFTVKYCSLIPVENVADTYKIDLIGEEEINKVDGAKFLNQCGQNNNQKIIDFLEQDKFKENTIFYYYLREKPIIKTFYQSLNYQPYSLPNLFQVNILATHSLKGIPNQLVEKLTQNLSYNNFIGKELNFSEMKKKLEAANNSNITKDSICLSEETEYDEEETIKEKDNELLISGDLTKEMLDNIECRFENINNNNSIMNGNGKNNIDVVKIFGANLDNITLFSRLMKLIKDKSIKKFCLYENNINSEFEGWDSIYAFLENNYNIRYLDFHCCNIYDYHLNALVRALTDKRIRLLNLSSNFLTLEGVKIVSSFLKNNKTLLRLNLSRNSQSEFKSEGVQSILESLCSNHNIEFLDFSYMNLTGCGESVGKFLSSNKSLMILNLRSVQLNVVDFKNIFNGIKISKSIKELDISYNDMGGDKSLQHIADGIKENKSLFCLKIDKININNDNYNIIFDAIKQNRNITNYCVNYNSKINPKIMLTFFIKQMQVKNLEYEPYDKSNPEDQKKELTLEEKKLFERFKSERPDMTFVYK